MICLVKFLGAKVVFFFYMCKYYAKKNAHTRKYARFFVKKESYKLEFVANAEGYTIVKTVGVKINTAGLATS